MLHRIPKYLKYPLALALLFSCAAHENSEQLMSIQTVDRNGFSETVSNPARLKQFEKNDFLTPQPYEKILRVYKRDTEGKSHSKLTSYHSNGGPWQYLEVADGRAHGEYLEWYPNGQLKMQAHVIEGTPDLSEYAQTTWVFDKEAFVFYEDGALLASIYYEKGLLERTSRYYHNDGSLQKEIPYVKNQIQGDLVIYNPAGDLLKKASFTQDKHHGCSLAYFNDGSLQIDELYEDDHLIKGAYYDATGALITSCELGEGYQATFEADRLHSLIEIHGGVIDGEIKEFDTQAGLVHKFCVHDGQLDGEEYFYDKEGQSKLMITWLLDSIHGPVKTWYPNQRQESQKEMNNNKKHGLSIAWYTDGKIMLIEEYEEDELITGTYYSKEKSEPISTIVQGNGVATLFDGNGRFLKKVTYEKSNPVLD